MVFAVKRYLCLDKGCVLFFRMGKGAFVFFNSDVFRFATVLFSSSFFISQFYFLQKQVGSPILASVENRETFYPLAKKNLNIHTKFTRKT